MNHVDNCLERLNFEQSTACYQFGPFEELVDKTLTFLYEGCLTHKACNLVIRWRVDAGLGDISVTMKTVKLFRSIFPSARLFLTAGIKGTTAKSNVTFDQKIRELFVGILSPEHLVEHLKKQSPKLPTILLDMATPQKNIDPFSDIKLAGCYHIYEYNYMQGDKSGKVGLFTRRSTYSMGIGLNPNNIPCTGIYFNEKIKNTHLRLSTLVSQLENRKLASWIKDGNARRQLNKKEFYFGYSSTADKGYWARFLNMIFEHETLYDNEIDVDIVLIGKARNWPSEFAEYVLPISWKDSKFCEIKLFTQSLLDTSTISLNLLSRRSVRVMLWNETYLSHRDTLRLMQASGKALLCTGDQSFSEVASLGDRVIFYDVRSWKRGFFNQYMELVKNHFGDESSLYNFLQCMAVKPRMADLGPTVYSRKMGQLLGDSTFLKQQQDFLDLLRTHYNVSHWLPALVSRCLAHHQSPSLIDDEDLAKEILVKNVNESVRKIALGALAGVIDNIESSKRVKRSRSCSVPVDLSVKKDRVDLYQQVTTIFNEENRKRRRLIKKGPKKPN